MVSDLAHKFQIIFSNGAQVSRNHMWDEHTG